MGDIWIGEIELTALVAFSSFFVVLPLQLLLCFKVKSLFLRLLPSLILAAITAIFFIMMRITTNWDAIGCAVLGVCTGIFLIFSGLSWGVFALFKCIKKMQNG